MTAPTYPVIEEKRLGPASRGLFGRYRPVAELPPVPPGATLVLRCGGVWEVLDDEAVHERDPRVISARAASVVQCRAQSVPVEFSLPTRGLADDFRMVVWFACRADSPARVAAAGLSDLTSILRQHLLADSRLRSTAADFYVEEVAEARRDLDDRIMSYCSVRPVRIDGMEVSCRSTSVQPPAVTLRHAEALRAKDREQEITEKDRKFDAQDVRAKSDLVRNGVHDVLGLGLHSGDLTPDQVAHVLLTERNQGREQKTAMIKILAEQGHLDGLSTRQVAELFGARAAGDAAALLPGLGYGSRQVVDAEASAGRTRGGSGPDTDRTASRDALDDEGDDHLPVDDD